jgi:hypothetical protein
MRVVEGRRRISPDVSFSGWRELQSHSERKTQELIMRTGGWNVKRVLAVLIMPTLLAACVTAPNGNYSDEPCTPSSNVFIGDNPLVGLAFTLVVDVTWFVGCETVVNVANGIRELRLAQVHHGVYVSPDHLFSVNVPNHNRNIEVREQIKPAQDYVYFVSSIPGSPVYAISVIPALPDKYAALSNEQFATQATAGLVKNASQDGGKLAGLQHVYQEELKFNNMPALFVVYRRDPVAANVGKPYFYLMYFIRNGNRAAILSVTWSGDCPKCTTGPEAAIRGVSPGLGEFVESFRLADPGKTL